jgi:tRNA threonylcarbamoyladenosine biosynthesis protein TsaB
MLILGVTTSHPECSMALMNHGALLGRDAFDGRGACVEELAPRIDRLLKQCGADYGEVDVYAADRGPGGLTGIKIGLVTVRTLAQIANRPTASCSSLRATACAAPAGADLIFSVSRCSHDEVYYAAFRAGDGLPERLLADAVGAHEHAAAAFAACAGERPVLTGNAAARVAECMSHPPEMTPESSWPPDAMHVCRLAAAAAHQPWNALQPNYLCITNAERMLARKKAGG